MTVKAVLIALEANIYLQNIYGVAKQTILALVSGNFSIKIVHNFLSPPLKAIEHYQLIRFQAMIWVPQGMIIIHKGAHLLFSIYLIVADLPKGVLRLFRKSDLRSSKVSTSLHAGKIWTR